MSPPTTKRLRFLRLAVLAMAVTGTLATAVAFLGEWHWYADLFAHLRPQYCFWLGLAAFGALYLRHRLAFLVAAGGFFANAAALAPYALPWHDTQEAPNMGRPWIFVSVNLLQGNRDVPQVTAYLRRVQADFVVFQEVTPRLAAELEELSDLYPHRVVESRKDQFGLAVFSRQKPVEVSIRAVGDREGDLALFAAFEIDGRRFSLVNIHPDKPDAEWKTRNRQSYLRNVAQWCVAKAAVSEPVVVLGDFNATPWSASMKSFTRNTGLRNTSQGVIFGATWNVWLPQRLLIDHAFLSTEWTLAERRVGPAIGSDHRPLLIRATLHSAETKK